MRVLARIEFSTCLFRRKCSKLCSHTIACAYQDVVYQVSMQVSKAGKNPQKRKASCKASTKVFAKLREQMSR